jgi:dihydrofolate reductase
MRRIIQIMHISLDGFVAGINGELDLFESAGEHLNFLNGLLPTSDSILLGRTTYEMFHGYWPEIANSRTASVDEINFSKWYNSVTKFVLSTQLSQEQDNKTILLNNDSITTIKNLKNQIGKDIFLFGSPKVGQLLKQENLIDEYWIFVNPVVFGAGVPMFDTSTPLTRLTLLETVTIPNGEVALHYSVRK